MKKILLFLIAVLAQLTVVAGGPMASTTLVPDKRVHDFGVIAEKAGKVSHTFYFTNRGRKPVAIGQVSAWCGCTAVDYDKQPVRPGHRARVTVTFNPHSRPGRFSKEVVLLFDGGTAFTRVWVKGVVKPYLHPVTEDQPYAYGHGLYMSHRVLPFSRLAKGEQVVFEFRVANNTPRPMTVELLRVPDNRVLQMPRVLKLKPQERRVVQVSYRAPKAYHYRRHIDVIPMVNGRKARPLRIVWM